MKKKAAIELSANFMVVIILGIVVFGIGIYLTYKMMDQANKISLDINEDARRQIWALLDTGRPVVAPLPTADVLRGKYAKFTIGVRNVGNTNTVFNMEIVGKDINDCDAADAKNAKIIQKMVPEYIKQNDEDVFVFAVDIQKTAKRPCTYTFYVQINKCDTAMDKAGECPSSYSAYETKQVISVSVP